MAAILVFLPNNWEILHKKRLPGWLVRDEEYSFKDRAASFLSCGWLGG